MKSQKEKALGILAKQIKELDINAILIQQELKTVGIPSPLDDARNLIYGVIKSNGYTLEVGTYKLNKIK
jgi:hypothetical protein